MNLIQAAERLPVALLLCLLAFSYSRPAHAEDDSDPEDAAEPSIYTIENLDRCVFNHIDTDEGEHRRRLEAELRLRVNRLSEMLGLDAAQAQRLKLAGGLGLRRFFERYDEARQLILEAKAEGTKPSGVAALAHALGQWVRDGLFGDGSTMAGVVPTVASDEQQTAYEQALAAQRGERFSISLELALLSLDRVFPLLEEERSALLTLAEKATQPPKTFGDHDHYYLLYQFSRLPPGEVRRIVRGKRGDALIELFGKGAAYGQYLEELGLLQREGEEPS